MTSTEDNKLTTTVFVPAGPVAANTILQTAIQSVRDAINVVYTLDPKIVAVSDRKTVEGVEGREYTVDLHYSAEGIQDAPPVDVDQVVKSLTVPTSSDLQAVAEITETA